MYFYYEYRKEQIARLNKENYHKVFYQYLVPWVAKLLFYDTSYSLQLLPKAIFHQY